MEDLKNKTKYICLEGRDMIGKETQVKLLVKALKEETSSNRVLQFRFPRYEGKYGKLMRAFLEGTEDLPITVYESLNWIDQKEWEEAFVPVCNEVADYVILDRFWPSMEAYSLAKGMREERVREMVSKLFQSDITIILWGEPWSNDKKQDQWERDMELTESVNQIMKLKCENRKTWHAINGNDERDVVHKKIMQVVQSA